MAKEFCSGQELCLDLHSWITSVKFLQCESHQTSQCYFLPRDIVAVG